MRIDTQNSFWDQIMGRQKADGLLMTGSMRAASARQSAEQQEFLQKVSALSEGSQAGSAKKQQQASPENVDSSEFSEFIISREKIPEAIEREMENYYHGVGNLVDNLTAMEEHLKYMQAKYDQVVAEGDTEKAAVIKEWNEKQYGDMTWMAGANLGISHFRIDHAQRLYGEEFGQEASDWLGDLPGQVKDISQGLKGAKSVEEALGQIAAAKDQLMGLADQVAERYQAYGGKVLDSHVYQTAEDFAGIKWDAHLLYPSGSLEKADSLLGEEYLKKLDLSQYFAQGNIVDLKA